MLQSCFKIKKSFTVLSEDISRDNKDPDKLKQLASEDWEHVKKIIDFLEPFKQGKFIELIFLI